MLRMPNNDLVAGSGRPLDLRSLPPKSQMNTDRRTLCRKEVAFMLGVSVCTLKRREREFGLDRARTRASRNPILYDRDKVLAVFLTLGVGN